MTKPWIARRAGGVASPRRPTQGSRAWTPARGSARNTAARAVAPDLDRGYLTDRLAPGWVEAARALGCVSVHCNSKYLTQVQADEVRSAGYWLLCYTVNEPSSARRLFSWGIDAIFTDRLDLIPPD